MVSTSTSAETEKRTEWCNTSTTELAADFKLEIKSAVVMWENPGIAISQLEELRVRGVDVTTVGDEQALRVRQELEASEAHILRWVSPVNDFRITVTGTIPSRRSTVPIVHMYMPMEQAEHLKGIRLRLAEYATPT